MKLLLSLCALIGLSTCGLNGSCCSDLDCPGAEQCSTDCRGPGAPRGECLSHCLVDLDCNPGQVCNQIFVDCGCTTVGDASSAVGTCSGNVGHGH